MKCNFILVVVFVVFFFLVCGGGSDNLFLFVEDWFCLVMFDYNIVFMGGVGSGEFVKVQFDMIKMIWQVIYVELLVL